jgi:hypothetical protein
MKAILEFDLPEENYEHQLAINAPNMAAAIEAIHIVLRSYRKYEDLNKSERRLFEKIDIELLQILQELSFL